MSSGMGPKDVSFAPASGDLVAGRYRVQRILGTGGMGVVLAAVDTTSGAPVAIKLLRAAEDRRAVDRFFREARAMSRIASDHVVRVLESGTADSRPYLVMEQLVGQDFAEQARGGRKLPVRDVVDAVLQACEALSHAHVEGIIHRDLKPSNLFLHRLPDGRGVVKMLDFGISKVKSHDVWEKTLTTTNDGGVLGSPPYMSPEQVRDPKAVDPRSDLWSLGVVMYKLLAGKLPFDGDSVGEVFARVLERPYPSLRTWGGVDVPPELDAIVGRCLAKERRDRFQHAGELAVALAPFASPEWAALAPTIAARMPDEVPTLSESGEVDAVSIGPTSEPRTLTLNDEVEGVPPPVAPTTNRDGGAPSSAWRASGDAGVLERSRVGASVTPTIGAAVIDPRPPAMGSSVADSRGRRGRALVALAAGVGLAVLLSVVIALGYRARMAAANAAPTVTATATATAVAAQPVASAVAPVASTVASAASTVPRTPAGDAPGNAVASAAPAAPRAVGSTPPSRDTRPARTGGGRRPSHGAASAAATTAAPASTSVPAPAATPRPELHPNPYGVP